MPATSYGISGRRKVRPAMKKVLILLTGMAATLATVLSGRSPTQTVQGDILRGQGRFLAGAGWYDLHTARADRINVETWKASNREVQRLYRDFMYDVYQHRVYRTKLTGKLQEESKRKFQEAQDRWRTNPNLDDILSG